jgi:hypothetical protein
MNANELENIALKFQSLKPNETNFNNTKTNRYFNKGDDSTLKDYLLTNNNTIRTHKKSISKNSLFLFNTINTHTLQSTKKISFKVPSKHLDDEVDSDSSFEKDDEEFLKKTRYSEKIDLDFNQYINGIEVYEKLLDVCKIKEMTSSEFSAVFKMIEKWFDLSSQICLYNLEVNDMDILVILKEAYIFEIITIGLVLNLYTEDGSPYSQSITQCLKIIYQNFMYITYFGIQISSNESPGLDKCSDIICSKIGDYKNYRKYIQSNNKLLSNELTIYIEQLSDEENHFFEYFYSILKNKSTLPYEDIRDYVYNELFLNNLLHHKVGEPEIVICDQSDEEAVNPPFLPAIDEICYTLVLDLDETLVHYVEEDGMAFVQIRPGTENFLNELKDYFEIVVFTAALSDVKIV